MKIIQPSVEFIDAIDGPLIMRKIELCGRVCYKSEDRITDESADRFVKMLIDKGHESVLEHVSLTVRIITDRAVANELVRHRIASYSQESTRYVRYDDVEFIKPSRLIDGTNGYGTWVDACLNAEEQYREFIRLGASPEIARSVLPLSTKTEIIVTYNLRQYREVIRQRTASAAHPDMRLIMGMIQEQLRAKLPVIFGGVDG